MSRPNRAISNRELLAYRAEFRNELFRQVHERLAMLKARGFTQKEMAARLSMNEGQLSRCLRGDNDLRLETLSDLARALDCRIIANLVPLHDQSVHFIRAEYSEDDPDTDNWVSDLVRA